MPDPGSTPEEKQALRAPAGRPLSERGFWFLFATQFQGAFSDNVFRFLVIFFITGAVPPEERDRLVPVVLALFALPFILFSMAGGHLADRFSKRSVAIGTKCAEIGIMTLGALGLLWASIPFLLFVTFLMGVQSAFFGPTKYGLLPELLSEQRLSWGNGLLGLGTFVAIISGGILAGVLSDVFKERQFWSGIVLIGLALTGLAASCGITRVSAANPGKKFRANFFGEIVEQFRYIRQDLLLLLAIFGAAYFWFLGALLEANIIIFGQDILLLEDDVQISYLRAALAIGIGMGSFAAGILSGKKIEYGLVPLGAVALTALLAVAPIGGTTFNRALIFLGGIGFFAGFYIVPILAIIQHRPEPRRKGSVIATEAWLSFVGVFLAAGVYFILTSVIGLGPIGVFLAGSAMTLAATAFALRWLPTAFVRLVLWLLTHSIYRIKVRGRENIPEKGGALFVCNHVSIVDALLLIASTDRHLRFMVDKDVYDRRWVKPVARILGSIPITTKRRPRELISALREASHAIREGHVVCMFAEGEMTRTGELLPFRRGFERVMKGVDAPIVPICLEGVWGSIFSFENGRLFWKWPKRIPYPVAVIYGGPLPANATADEVRQAVRQLKTSAGAGTKLAE